MPVKRRYYFDGEYFRCKVKKGATAAEGYKTLRAKTEPELDAKKREYETVKGLGLNVDENITVVAWCAEWFNNRKARFSDSVLSYISPMLNNIVGPQIGRLRLAEVRPEHCQRIMSAVADKSHSYQSKLVRLLKTIFNDAKANRYISINPALEIKAAGNDAKEKNPLTKKQMDALFKAVKGTRAETFVAIGYYSGLRRQEICGLQWVDIDIDSKSPSLTVNSAVTWPDRKKGVYPSPLKTENSHRTIPLHPKLLETLTAEKAKSKSPFIIAGRGQEPISYSSFQRLWELVEARTKQTLLSKPKRVILPDSKKKPNIEKTLDFIVTPHYLRHTFATNLVASGMDIKKVQYLTGHKDVTVLLKIYAHFVGTKPEQLSEAVTKAL